MLVDCGRRRSDGTLILCVFVEFAITNTISQVKPNEGFAEVNSRVYRGLEWRRPALLALFVGVVGQTGRRPALLGRRRPKSTGTHLVWREMMIDERGLKKGYRCGPIQASGLRPRRRGFVGVGGWFDKSSTCRHNRSGGVNVVKFYAWAWRQVKLTSTIMIKFDK